MASACLIKSVLQKRIVETRCGINVDINEATVWSCDVACVKCLELIAEGRVRVATANAVGKP